MEDEYYDDLLEVCDYQPNEQELYQRRLEQLRSDALILSYAYEMNESQRERFVQEYVNKLSGPISIDVDSNPWSVESFCASEGISKKVAKKKITNSTTGTTTTTTAAVVVQRIMEITCSSCGKKGHKKSSKKCMNYDKYCREHNIKRAISKPTRPPKMKMAVMKKKNT